MANNPFAGKIPLNYQQHNQKKIGQNTSYRPGKTHPMMYNSPNNDRTIMPRNDGCTLLRRYPDGRLDIGYVAGKIIDVLHKIKDKGFVTEMERALISLILPKQFGNLVDAKIAATMTKITKDEQMILALKISQHMKEELNYNAGMGGSSLEGRSSTRS